MTLNAEENGGSVERTGSKKSLSHFFLFWGGQKISLFGSEVVQFAITWAITILFQDASLLSISVFLSMMPKILLGPLAGVMADRYSYKKLILIFDFLQAFATFWFFVLLNRGFDTAFIFLLFISIRSINQAFQSPVVSIITPLMVPKEKITKFEGINQLVASVVMMLSPILSAFLIGVMELKYLLWIDIFTFIIAFLTLFLAKIPQNEQLRKNGESAKKLNLIKEFKDGLGVFNEVKGLKAIFFIGIFGILCLSPLNALLNYFISVTHGGTIRELTIVTVVIQVALVLGSLLIIVKKQWKRKTLLMVSMSILLFLGLAIMALSPKGNFMAISIGILIAFLGLPAFGSTFMAIVEIIVPIQKMGRFSAFRDSILTGLAPFGIVICGPLANLLGIKELFLITSALGIFVPLLVYWFSDLKSLDHLMFEHENAPQDNGEKNQDENADRNETSDMKEDIDTN